jgi:glycosyltransferase involved in cell wall biosynthesis
VRSLFLLSREFGQSAKAIFDHLMSLKISIITVCLNAADVIERCLSSVAEQTHPDIEYLLIDGVSTDGTLDVVQKYEKTVSYLVSEKDDGIYPAMNKGLAKATGDFVLFLGADDYLVDNKVIADVVAAMQAETADLYYGLLEVRYPGGRVHVYDAGIPDEIGQTMILGCLPSQASFIKRSAFESIGLFDNQYSLAADYDWYLKALSRPEFKFAKIDRLCSSYFFGGASSNLEKCRPEMDLIQNRSTFYQTPQWQQCLIQTWQQDSLSWRLERNELEGLLADKTKDADTILEDKIGMLKERKHLLQEVDKLRQGVDALDAERNKLQYYLSNANVEMQRLIRELEQRQETSTKLPHGLKRSIQSRFNILRKRFTE